MQSIAIAVTGEEGEPFTLPGQAFTESNWKESSHLLTQFSLEPGESWSRFVHFHALPSSENERQAKRLVKDLRNNIIQKLRGVDRNSEDQVDLTEADEAFVVPLIDFFTANRKWRAGQYRAVLSVACTPDRASISKEYRFTLFESDSAELEERTTRYKFGAGLYWEDQERQEIYARLEEQGR